MWSFKLFNIYFMSKSNLNDLIVDIFYNENKDNLNSKFSKENFMASSKETQLKISKELKLNLKFVLTFGTAITAFFPLVKTFIETSGIEDIHIDNSTIAYLSICAIAIALDTPKKEYRQLFTELRMRNVYGLLENLTYFIKKLPDLFNILAKTIGNVTYEVIGMFNYTILFVPFILSLDSILSKNEVSLSSIMNVIGNDPNMAMKLTAIGIGVTGITIREIIVDTIKNMKKFKSDSSYITKDIKKEIDSSLKDIIKDVSPTKIDKDLKSKEDKTEHDKIYKWSEWKDKFGNEVERVDEDR